MSVTMQEARSKCPMGVDKCEECFRYLDNCDGKDWDEEEENSWLFVRKPKSI